MLQRPIRFGWFILILSLVTFGGLYLFAFKGEVAKMDKLAALTCQSDIRLRLTLDYDKPPIYQEEYLMTDADGISNWSYRVRAYQGKQITVVAPKSRTYDVAFLFGLVVQDGIWKLVNQPQRGNTGVHYTLYVKQTAFETVTDPKSGATKTVCGTGDRTITFTDPHWLATQAGRQYHIDLSAGSPKSANDLLKMSSSTLDDPRFEKIVNDFKTFGPETYRTKVAAARATLAGKR